MINLEHQIDLSKQISEEPQIETFLKQAIKLVEKQEAEIIAKFKKPVFDEDLENHLIVTNIPDVTGKQQKFQVLFRQKILDKKKIGTNNGLQKIEFGYKMVGQQKRSNNTLFVIYKTAANAKKAFQKLHMMKFDKEHQLSCFTVKQFRLVQKLSENYIEPKLFPKKQKIQYNLDKFDRDQLIYRLSGSDSERLYIKWFDHVQKTFQDAMNIQGEEKSMNIKERVKNIVTSPRGSYVAICTSQGVRLFVGTNLQQKAFYPHHGACQVSFSPNQNYMITYTGVQNASKAYESVILWSIQEQVSLYTIRAGSFHDSNSIQFTSDDRRLAIVGENQVYIHDCSSFENLKESLKKSEDDMIQSGLFLKALNIKKAVWMPDKQNLLCICYELNPNTNTNPTSKIYFYNFQTKEERKWRAIGQHIKKVDYAISDNAQWVAVSFKKVQKKSQNSTSIYIVNLSKRQIETEVKDFKQNVVSISWDTAYGRFGAVHEINTGVRSAHTQYAVQFFQVNKKNNIIGTSQLGIIGQTPLNRLIMAQNGVYFSLYNISPQSSGRDKYTLGYINKDTKNKKSTIEIVKENNQVSYMTYFFMDPSGRFVVLGTDKMFQVWNMAGQLIFKNNQTLDVKNVQFRQRYINRISTAQEKKIAEKEKQLLKKYQDLDQQRTNALQYQKQLEKKQKRQNFKNFLTKKRQWHSSHRESLAAIRGFDQQDPNVKSAQYQYLQIQRN